MKNVLMTNTELSVEGMLTELPVAVSSGVYGVGVDIASIERMKLAINRSGEKFLNLVYSESEQEYCESAEKKYERYSACWAAKEAAVKALGTGFRYSISFKDIELKSGDGNRPTLNLSGKFYELMQEKDVNYSQVSISHEGENAVAVVMLCRI
ncbi:MAG: holo-[acyl-carrier protein] synthase [Oceanicoccus sp.]|jgi:holo-[acyl-carrier protein] synthase